MFRGGCTLKNGTLIVTMAVLGSLALTGCGTHATQTTASTAPSPTQSVPGPSVGTHASNTVSSNYKIPPVKEVPVPTKALPVQIMQHLKPYASRLEHVTSLPVTVPNGTKNVLVISALTAYAIPQFQSVWSQLHDKPAVVWVGLTQAQTERVWKQAGYAGDPLPSAVTLYEDTSLPVPIAYHRVANGWEVVPGILPASQVHDWLAFFEGAKP